MELECYRGEGRPEPEVAPAVLARFCNTLLSERLAKAPEVYCTAASDSMVLHNKTIWDGTLTVYCDTHSARLVCIEEVKK